MPRPSWSCFWPTLSAPGWRRGSSCFCGPLSEAKLRILVVRRRHRDRFVSGWYPIESHQSSPQAEAFSQMSTPEPIETQPADENVESFESALTQFERSQTHKSAEAGQGREATVITVSADSVVLDVGFKTEGILPI